MPIVMGIGAVIIVLIILTPIALLGAAGIENDIIDTESN